MNTALFLAETACTQTDGAPMTWWQALIMVIAIFALAIAMVVVAVLLSGPRR